MLLELSIRDFAIIDETRIDFQSGMNALTGETGAGKSILIDSLGAVLGERVTPDVVRAGAKSAVIDATFYCVPLFEQPEFQALIEELGIELDDNVLILSREISATGRSTARINGRASTAATLARLGAFLVDIHGQSDHLSLLRPANQLDLLDRYAGLIRERGELASVVRELHRVRGAIESITGNERERARQLDLLRFQVDEIAAANLSVDEEAALGAERAVLANAERLTNDAGLAYGALTGDDTGDTPGAVSLVQLAVQALHDIAGVDQSRAGLAERASELGILLQDVAAEIRDYRDEIEVNPARLAEIEDRQDLLKSLQRKYGASVAEVIAFGENAARELDRLEQLGGDVEHLRERETELRAEAEDRARALSRQRQAVAAQLGAAVEGVLADLNMSRSRFVVQVTPSDANPPAIDVTGLDRVEFLLAPHGGEALRPLARVASGGETARLMLAMKSILSSVDETPVLVFDEIDVGVGGRSGHVVGEKLWALSRDHQVIVISHLPQIAAFAETHFKISKAESGGRLVSRVNVLDEPERIDELAAMLDGAPVTDASRASAVEMVDRAERWKREHQPLVGA